MRLNRVLVGRLHYYKEDGIKYGCCGKIVTYGEWGQIGWLWEKFRNVTYGGRGQIGLLGEECIIVPILGV